MVIKVDVLRALRILEENKTNHIEEYALQLQGWQEAMEIHSKKMKQWVDAGGELSKRPKEPVKPEEYSNEYNDFIKKLSFHVDSTIGLEEYEFDKIINNNFGWKQNFLSNSVTYGNLSSVHK